MEDDPYEIWREAMKDIDAHKALVEDEAREYADLLIFHARPGQADPEVLARAWKILLGDKMDEEKKEQDRFTRALAMVRGFTFLILVAVISLLTLALVADWLNGTEFIAASFVWFGMGVLFLWGTEFVKKEKEDE